MPCWRRMQKIISTDRVRNEVLNGVKEETNILLTTNRKKAESFRHILRRNCLLRHIIEGKIDGRIKVTGRWGRRRKKLLNDPKEHTGYCKLKEETLDHILWRTRFWRGRERMNAVGIQTRSNFRYSPSLKNMRKTTIDFSQVVTVRQRFEPQTSRVQVKIVSAGEILVGHSCVGKDRDKRKWCSLMCLTQGLELKRRLAK